MSEWANIRWTQARQITRLMGVRDEPPEAVTPNSWWAALRDQGDKAGAVAFLGHALPRLEAVQWGVKSLTRLGADDAPALRTLAESWVQDPTDEARRQIWSAAEAADEDSPWRLLGYGLFFSGGSIAPVDQAPVNPAPELCGRMVAAAITTAAHRRPDTGPAFDTALSIGDGIARGEG